MKKSKCIWICGWLIIVSCAFCAHYFINKSLRDYFIIMAIITIGEVVYRQFHGHKGHTKNIYFILELREDNLIKLLEKFNKSKIKNKNIHRDAQQEINDLVRLTENSLAMLGVLLAITLTLVILAISMPIKQTAPSEIDLEIFVVSGFITFVIFLIDLALCYSMLEPAIKKIPDIIINGMRRYYYLTMFGMLMLGVTFVWGIYTYTPLFHPDTLLGIITLMMLAIVLLFFYRVYVYYF